MLKRKTDDTVILKLHREGKSQRQIARELGFLRNVVLMRLEKLLSVTQTSVNLTKPDMLRKTKVLVNVSTPNTSIRRQNEKGRR